MQSATRANRPVNEDRVIVCSPPDSDLAQILKELQEEGRTIETCRSTDELCQKLSTTAGLCVLSSAALDARTLSSLRELLGGAPTWSDLPLIVLLGETESEEDTTGQAEFISLGNVRFVDRPLRRERFLEAVRAATRDRQRQYRIRDLQETQDRALAKRAEQLQATNEQMEAFVYSISHDLRAPLRAIRGFAQALAEDYGPALEGPGKEYLDRISQGADRLDRLIHDLLLYSRLGRADVDLVAVDLDRSLQRALRQLQSEISASGAGVEVETPLPPARADALTLELVLVQLLGNAIKFVAPGVKPHIRLRAELGEESVRLSVRDNGLGIDPAYHQRIFGVFERLHSAESFPGTGIGLALVARGVARMGGSVGVESELGQGSRFWIELPRATCPPAPSPLEPVPDEYAPAPPVL